MTLFVAFALLFPSAPRGVAQRQMERLGRGVVAVKQPDGKVRVGWRVLGTDDERMAFNI